MGRRQFLKKDQCEDGEQTKNEQTCEGYFVMGGRHPSLEAHHSYRKDQPLESEDIATTSQMPCVQDIEQTLKYR